MGINGHTILCEDYVSFETAKQLKEKGFNEMTELAYGLEHGHIRNDLPVSYWRNSEIGKYKFSCPTLQMAMKWLREVHNLCIEPYRTASGYLYTISKIWTGSEIYSDEFNGDDEYSGQWTTYEKACEAGIKYCLENLI